MMSDDLKGRILLTIADTCASLIALRRELIFHKLTDDECEAAGLPFGSTERAVHVGPLSGARWWHVAAYLDRSSKQEGCLELRAFGWCAEVFYVRRNSRIVGDVAT